MKANSASENFIEEIRLEEFGLSDGIKDKSKKSSLRCRRKKR